MALYKNECRHGMAYTKMLATYSNISSEVRYYVPLNQSYEVWSVRLTNESDEERELSVTGYAEFTNNSNYEQDQGNLQYSQFITRTVFCENRVRQMIHGNLDEIEEGKDVDNKIVINRFMLSAQVDNGGGFPLVKFTHNPGNEDTMNPFSFPDGDDITEEDYKDADAVVYVVSRISGEGKNRRLEEGDCYLSKREVKEIKMLCETKPVIILINAGGVVEITDILDKEPSIKAVLKAKCQELSDPLGS